MGSHRWCDHQPSELSVIQLSVIVKEKKLNAGIYVDYADGADDADGVDNADDDDD